MKLTSLLDYKVLILLLALALALPTHAQSPAPTIVPVACTITVAAPLEAYDATGSMTGVSQATVGQGYQCLRVEGDKAVLQDAAGKIFKIRVNAVSQTPKMPTPPAVAATPAPAPAAIAPTPAASTPKPTANGDQTPTPSPYVPDGYTYVWGDEFNEPTLDISKWWTRIIYGDGYTDHLNDEQERYRENNNHVMTGTSLDLTARKVADHGPKGVNYDSGMIRSKATFKYAYFEIRCKVPAGKGTWPAFWMTSDADSHGHATWPPEMDPLEMAMNIKDDKPNMLLIGSVVQKGKDGISPTEGKRLWAADPPLFDAGPGTSMYGYYHAPFNFPDDYHVFALLWESDDTITFFCDGVKLMKGVYKWKTWSGDDAPYAHVLANLAIGGGWAGKYGVDDSAFPQALSIDYIRVYQNADGLKGVGPIGHDLYKPPAQ